MDREVLRLLLLVAKSGRVNLLQLARDLGWDRKTVYEVLVWRQRKPTPRQVAQVLDLVGAHPGHLLMPVSLTPNQLSDAVRKLGLDLDAEDLTAGVGVDEAARLSAASLFMWVDGRLRMKGGRDACA